MIEDVESHFDWARAAQSIEAPPFRGALSLSVPSKVVRHFWRNRLRI
jgi:hypothetical protein